MYICALMYVHLFEYVAIFIKCNNIIKHEDFACSSMGLNTELKLSSSWNCIMQFVIFCMNLFAGEF